MHEYKVGSLFHPGRTSWPEGSDYHLRADGHELRLFIARHIQSDIDSVRTGDCHFAFYSEGSAIVFLYKFDHGFPWCDQPYSWHLTPPDIRVMPQEPQELERGILRAYLVSSEDGILRAMRMCSFSVHFTRLFHQAIREQAEAPWDQARFDADLERAYRLYDSDQLARRAVAKCRGGQ